MRYFFLLSVLVCLLAGCGTSDSELLKGTWVLRELKMDGELVFTTDEQAMEKAIERILSEQIATQDTAVRNLIAAEIRNIGKMTYTFVNEKTFQLSGVSQGEKIETTGKMRLDPDKKELVMVDENGKENTFVYTINGDELHLKGDDKSDVLLQRKQ